jgi:hypothetical protein
VPSLSCFKRFRRLCGNSSELASVAIVADDAGESAWIAEGSFGVWDVKLKLLLALAGAREDAKLPFGLGLTYNRLAEKYDL